MAQFQAIVPGVEVKGAAVLAVCEGMGAFRDMAIKILARHDIHNPSATRWFSQQAWLDAFKEIAETIGLATLKAIGNKIPETASWPPEIQTIEQALSSIDVAYHMNHRKGEIGHYKFSVTSPNSGEMVCDNPYPCEFDLGIIESTAKKFAPKDTKTIIIHDRTKPCRKKFANSCTYLVTWEQT